MFIIAIIWNINIEIIYLDINISLCIGTYSLLTALTLHSLKVYMVTMETTFHKKKNWQYMHAMIMAKVVLLNVYCVYNCNYLEYKYRNNIS